MIIKLEQFNGLIPGVAAHLLPPTFAQTATNCKLVSGSLDPWKANLFSLDLAAVQAVKSLFFHESTRWFNWTTDVNAVRGPIAADAYKRAYWTDGTLPKYGVVAQQTGPDYPTDYYTLGIPDGNTTPTITPTATPSGYDPRLAESRAYVYTFVSAYGEEGPPSPPSAITVLHTDKGQTCTVGNMGTTAPTGDFNITHKRIYRTNMGTSGTIYQYVDQIAIGTATYADTKEASALGVELPSSEWYGPPATLHGLISLPCGSLCGFTTNKEVCFSEPFRPHAWPPSYRKTTESPIVGVGAFGMSVAVMTQGFPEIITGEAPGKMSKEKLEIGEICLSKRGIVDLGYMIMYPSPDGLAMISSGNLENATEKILSREKWELYKPTSINAYNYRGMYVGFYDTGTGTQAGFVFDPKTGNFTDLNFHATAGYGDPDTGTLYLVLTANNNLYKFDADTSKMSATWKSKPYNLPEPVNPGAAQVFADTYTGTLNLKVYGDGVLKQTKAVTSSEPFKLVSGYLADKVEIQIETTNVVNRVYVAETMDELKQAEVTTT